jgi:dephospho-CoA kinase
MIKIGITGGIGSGKSVVSELLTILGIPVYFADSEAKRLTNTNTKIRAKLIALFGQEIYTPAGLDKKKMASHIFNDKDLLVTVNGIIHPEVLRDFNRWTQEQAGGLCAIESAILMESGFDMIVDKKVMVYAPFDLRIARASKRDRVPVELVKQRAQNQLSDEIKKELSDYVVYNDDQTAIIPQVYALIHDLKQ